MNDGQATEYINSFDDWRGNTLKELRELINATDLHEGFKWSVPVWTGNKMVCAISGFKDHVKINFFKGAHLSDQSAFNSGLDSKDHRSINISSTDKLDKAAIKQLILAAVAYDKGE